MMDDYNPVLYTLLGTLFTWGMTAIGSAMVFILSNDYANLLNSSMGFASGVMLAASFWSLLQPALEMSALTGLYGERGEFAFVPVAVGLVFGAAFVHASDSLIEKWDLDFKVWFSKTDQGARPVSQNSNAQPLPPSASALQHSSLKKRREVHGKEDSAARDANVHQSSASIMCWRQVLLMIVAITVHNIPEGLAVGVGFGSVGRSPHSTVEKARNIAMGIGIQNFPEGLAVSLPLRALGCSPFRSFWYGQLSGLVEPFAGLLGVVFVMVSEPLLPAALAFAAGAMIFVVVDDLIPLATRMTTKISSWSCMLGFVVMMSLDTGLS